MMDIFYKTPSKEIQDIVFANVTYEAVIEGLNGYFASEPRNDYITVKMEFDDIKQDFALHGSEAWADILISWLRTEHGIFYRPGMTIDQPQDIMNYIRQEASRNGFKLPEEIDNEPLTVKRVFHDLLELLRMKETRIKTLNAELATKWTKTSLINWLQQRARHKGVELDDTFLYSDDTQYDWTDIVDFLFDEIVKMRGEIKEANDQRWNDLRDIYKALGRDGTYDTIDGFAKAVEARAEYVESLSRNAEREVQKTFYDILEALGISKSCSVYNFENSELNARVIRRATCIKSEHDRYLEQLDKAEEEVKKLKEQKDRAAAILQDLYRDIFHKDCTQFTYEDIANKILDKVLETEDLLHKSVDSVNKECKATGKLMVEDYKLKLKDYILKDIKKHGYRHDGLDKKSIEEIVDFIVTMATCPIDGWAKDEIENLRRKIKRLKDLINAMNEEVKDM